MASLYGNNGVPLVNPGAAPPSGLPHGGNPALYQGEGSTNWQIWNKMYQDYLSKIEKYKGTARYDQLLNNPYIQYQDYDPTFFEGLFGSTTGMQNFWNSRQTQALEALGQIQDADYQNEYNSPVQQAARETAAGINPNIAGVQGEPAADASPAVETAPVTSLDGADGSFEGLATGSINFLQGCIGLYQSLSSLGLLNAQKANAVLGAVSQANDLALSEVAGKKPMFTDANGNVDYAALSDHLLNPSNKSALQSYKGLRGPARRYYKRAVGTLMYDAEGRPTTALRREYTKQAAESAIAHKQAGEAIAETGMPDGLLDLSSKMAETILQAKVKALDLQNTARKLENDLLGFRKQLEEQRSGNYATMAAAEGAQAQYNADLYGTTDGGERLGETEGKARAYMAQINKLQARWMKLKQETWNKLYDGVDSWKNPIWRGIGMNMLPGLQYSVDAIFESGGNVINGFSASLGEGLGGVANAYVSKGLGFAGKRK